MDDDVGLYADIAESSVMETGPESDRVSGGIAIGSGQELSFTEQQPSGAGASTPTVRPIHWGEFLRK